MQNLSLYHYGIVDGTMLFQGLLVIEFYYINLMFLSQFISGKKHIAIRYNAFTS